MKYRKFSVMCVIIFFVIGINFGFADSFTKGEAKFRANQPQEAIVLLKKAVIDPYVNPSAYIYLGLSYYQLGQFQNSIDTFVEGTKKSGTNKRVLYFNAGNSAFAMGDLKQAEDFYSMAIVADSGFSSAVLNRANARLKQDKLSLAAEDYTQYLILDPESSQDEQIRKVLELIRGEIVLRKQEEERLAKEAERIKAEEQRVAAELEAQRIENERIAAEKAAIEAERRKKLLEEVSASLQGTESTNVSAGTDGVMGYTYESELD